MVKTLHSQWRRSEFDPSPALSGRGSRPSGRTSGWGRSHEDIPDVASWGVPHSVGPRFPGPLLIRPRCPDTSPKSSLWMQSTRRGSFSVHRSEKTPGSQYSSTSGLSPRGHLERQAEFHNTLETWVETNSYHLNEDKWSIKMHKPQMMLKTVECFLVTSMRQQGHTWLKKEKINNTTLEDYIKEFQS